MARDGRKTHLQVIHEVSFALDAAKVVAAGGRTVQFGVLPAGAILATYHSVCTIPFDSTTITVNIGTVTPNGGEILGPQNLKVAQRLDGANTAIFSGPFPVDTPVYWTVTLTGPQPTVGSLVFYQEYLPGPG